MPTGYDLVLIPRRPEEPTLDELMRSLPRLVRNVTRRIEKEGSSS